MLQASTSQVNLGKDEAATEIYTIKGDAHEVVSVTNNTTRTSFEIARPGSRLKEQAAKWAMAIAAILSLASTAVFSLSFGVALLMGVTSVAAAYLSIERATSPRVRRGSPAAALAA